MRMPKLLLAASLIAVAVLAYPVIAVGVSLAAEAVAVGPTAAPAAAAPIVVAEVSWWQTLWAQVQAPLVALVTAVLSALGVVIMTQVRSFLGERAAQSINAVYQNVAEQAAGWLIAQLHSSADPTVLTTGKVAVPKGEAARAINGAVDYAKQSYPDVLKKLGTTDNELGKDILAAAGKILGAGGSPIGGIASVVGGLLGNIPR